MTKLAVVVDPVLENVSRDLTLLQEMGLKVKGVIVTSCAT